MTTSQTLVTLNNGLQIPALGFGVFQTPPDETVAAVTTALEDGYRLIDTTASYDNEREVGSRRSGDRRRAAPATTWCLSRDSVAGPGA